jgi:hypothetical protein
MLLSLLIPYRNRQAHLQTLINWFSIDKSYAGRVEVILLELDEAPTSARALVTAAGMRYQFIECPGVFHKTRALNIGLALSESELVTPFDVDLVPIDYSLNRQLQAALALPDVLITAYRLLSSRRQVQPDMIKSIASKSRIAAEDGKSALRKHLVFGERFGQVPMFAAKDLRRLGGWDEGFIGWGAEDQEVIERYVAASGRLFVRAPDFTYLHLFHGPAELWNEPELVQKNRKRHLVKRNGLQPV